jgi:CheY-like chemotaxis protein
MRTRPFEPADPLRTASGPAVLVTDPAGLGPVAFRCPVRLVAVTTRGRPADRERSRAAGIDRHLLKPADPAELLDLHPGVQSR